MFFGLVQIANRTILPKSSDLVFSKIKSLGSFPSLQVLLPQHTEALRKTKVSLWRNLGKSLGKSRDVGGEM